ncbi:MAG: hypothetical protein HY906_09265, partial [Deltaproteobacteria bacterium]|nr:hypothetical protein [Deltaproteobacteria bacterium]
MLRLYLDTSVLSALLDERAPDRQAQRRDSWARRAEFEVATCELTAA